MSSLKEKKVEDYYALSPTEYRVLESFILKQNAGSNGVMKQTLSLGLQRSSDPPTAEILRLEFHGVTHLRLLQPDLSLISISHIEISPGEDVPRCTRGYYVRDPSQQEVIRFCCEDFSATVA